MSCGDCPAGYVNDGAKGCKPINDQECDIAQGETYLRQSSSKASNLAACRKSCEDEATCQSITYYHDGWCSHFSTRCENTKTADNAHAMRLKDFTTTTAKPGSFNGKECDTSRGENWLGQTSGHSSDLAACKKSCMDDAKCQSITYYQDKWCSHFSTRCENTKDVVNAHAVRVKDFKTTPKPDDDYKHEECDVSQGEIYRHKSSGIVDDYAACEKSCMDEVLCQSITFYFHGWCSHFSTQCKNRKTAENAVAKNLKNNFFRNQACDMSKGEIYLGGSSADRSDMAACAKSCDDEPKCNSITFFRSGWCSHFSTCCKNRKAEDNADSLRMKDCATTKAPTTTPGLSGATALTNQLASMQT